MRKITISTGYTYHPMVFLYVPCIIPLSLHLHYRLRGRMQGAYKKNHGITSNYQTSRITLGLSGYCFALP
jgi:hypothetical protein